MPAPEPVTFGLKTSPVHMSYQDIQRAWLQADEIPEIEHAWLWDHLLPLTGPRDGIAFEGWTLLAALAAQTRRLRLGLMVTSNRIREPAVLGKMATTVDVISGGRLVLGIGVGGTVRPDQMDIGPAQHNGLAEYAAYGLTAVPPAEGIARLSEAVAILRRMFTEDEFDFDGQYYQLAGTVNRSRPGRPLWSAARVRGCCGWPPSRPTSGMCRVRPTRAWSSSPSAAGSWTGTARTSAGIRPASPGRCSC